MKVSSYNYIFHCNALQLPFCGLSDVSLDAHRFFVLAFFVVFFISGYVRYTKLATRHFLSARQYRLSLEKDLN